MTIGPPLVAYITHPLIKLNDLHIRTGACLLRVITFIHQHRYNFFLASSQITGNRTYLRDHIILCLSHWSIYVSLINDTFRFNIKGRISNTNFAN